VVWAAGGGTGDDAGTDSDAQAEIDAAVSDGI
jgi:hypothetical protein